MPLRSSLDGNALNTCLVDASSGTGEKLPAHPEGKIRVLLIDDEPEFLELTKFFLDREGSMEVAVASTAKEGLGKLEVETVDAIVSDYSMPEMDGLEFLKILRARGLDVPFILLTGKGREDVAIEALNSGADFYVRKGTDPKTQYAEIVNFIKAGVGRTRAVEAASAASQFLSRVFNSIRDGICVLDRNRTIIMANAVIEEWYPHLRPIVGKKCWEVFHSVSESEHDEVCPGKRTVETGEVSSELIPRHDADGNRIGTKRCQFELHRLWQPLFAERRQLTGARRPTDRPVCHCPCRR